MPAIDERIELVEYDPDWPTLFEDEAERLRAGLPMQDVDAIQHIGSTGVEGMPAKPTVDIMIGIAALPPGAEIDRALLAMGYESFGEAGVPGRFHFRLRDGKRSFNVHIVEHGGRHWRSNVALRDYLSADADARRRYATAKQSAIGGGARTLIAYSDEKAALVAELVAEALAWQATRDS